MAQGHQKVTFLYSGCCAASRRQMGPGRAELQEDTDEQCGLGDPHVLHPDPACFHFLSRKCHSQGLVVALCTPVLKTLTCPLETSHGEARRKEFLFLSLSRPLVFLKFIKHLK